MSIAALLVIVGIVCLVIGIVTSNLLFWLGVILILVGVVLAVAGRGASI